MSNMNLPNPSAGSSDERTMATIVHVLAIVIGFLGPLIIWLIKKDDSQFVKEHALESLNFQLVVAIAYVAASALICTGIGIFLFPVAWVLSLVFEVQGAMSANRGEMYRYPFNPRLVK